MKTTVEMPDDLMIEVKVQAARERRKLKDLLPELVRAGLEARREARPLGRPYTPEEVEALLERLRAIGEDVERHSVDPRSAVEILHDDRR